MGFVRGDEVTVAARVDSVGDGHVALIIRGPGGMLNHVHVDASQVTKAGAPAAPGRDVPDWRRPAG